MEGLPTATIHLTMCAYVFVQLASVSSMGANLTAEKATALVGQSLNKIACCSRCHGALHTHIALASALPQPDYGAATCEDCPRGTYNPDAGMLRQNSMACP